MNKQTNPNGYNLLCEWVKRQTQLAGQPADILEKIPVENLVDVILNTQGRVLYDFLSDHNIHTGVWPVEDTITGTTVWKWRVIGKSPTVESSTLTRKEAETKVFEEGMKRLG